MANTKYYGTGRRKSSVARVYLVPGTGKITINKRDMDEYFGLETLKVVVRQPLTATETADKFDVLVNGKKVDSYTANIKNVKKTLGNKFYDNCWNTWFQE